MKRTLLFFATLFVFVYSVLAEPVDPDKALQIAKQFVPQTSKGKKVQKKGETPETSSIVYTHKMPKSNRAAFYIVNVGDGSFVLVSADDVAHQILGYSFDKSFPIAEDGTVQLPPHIKGFFDDLAAQIEAAIEKEPNRSADDDWTQSTAKASHRAPSNLPDSVGPLLTTTWDQGQYYNAFCPADANGPDGHVLTGCVATAMAQIINYWGSPVHGRGTHSYDTTYGTLSVNYAESNYDFNNMPDELTVGSTETQVNAVAKLMYDCGIAANMEYGAAESGAYSQDARAALINFFRFSSDLSFAEKAFFSNDEWNSLMRENLAANQPVIYSGFGTEGHTFVLDGYKEDDYFHFNFGWGSFADGWYLTSSVNPDNSDYNSEQSALVGIVPDDNGNVILGQMQGTSTFIVDEPLEFYHLMGHNAYEGNDYTNPCNNTITFIPANQSRQMVLDVVEYECQGITIYDGTSTDIYMDVLDRNIFLRPVKTPSSNAITLVYSGNFYYEGFQLGIGYEDDCRYVSNVSIQSIKQDATDAISVRWIEKGGATQWDIRYRKHGMPNSEYNIIHTENNPCIITGLPMHYKYDFSVRAIHDQDHKSGWSSNKTFLFEIPYWTDIVTECPSGYQEDMEGNVEISSAEGLAWLSVLVNGLQGHKANSFDNKTISLTADIDLGGYRWYPMGRYINWNWTKFSGTFDAQDHSISNIYVLDDGSNLGLFGHVYKGNIRNVNMVGGSVSSTREFIASDSQDLPSSLIGGLAGYVGECYEITNCHSSVNVLGNGEAGSLCGMIWAFETQNKTIVSNCSASGTVTGREACGGLVGDAFGNVEIKNCYALGDVFITACDFDAMEIGRGGLIGSAREQVRLYNCYAIGNVYTDLNYEEPVGKVIGYQEKSHGSYLYGLDDNVSGSSILGSTPFIEDLTDTIQFHHDGSLNMLNNSITINGEAYTDLLNALNAWVVMQNEYNLKTWRLDTNTGYPIFGNNYEPTCSNPTDLAVTNATEVGSPTIRTQLSWTQVGDPDHWEVLYVASEHDISEGVIVSVDSNPCVLTDIPVGQPLDFYVRAINDGNVVSYWSHLVTYIPDKLRWTEVVTSKPEGYTEDSDGNVYISSAEGLAWLASVINGINGEKDNYYKFVGKHIELTSDVDLSAYRWNPIGDHDHPFTCQYFTGNNHVISGLYCNELSDYQGLFGNSDCNLYNLIISQCDINGGVSVGAVVGAADGDIINCIATGRVRGMQTVGGITGHHIFGSINNTLFNGNITSRNDITRANVIGGFVGGICGSPYYNSISNCYVVSEITDAAYSGIITGTGSKPNNVSNCYYKDYETSLPITSDNCATANNSSFSGSGSSWTLTTPPLINGKSYSDLVDALNAWVDENNSEGQYRHWVADMENKNGGYPIFTPAYTLTYKVDGEIYKTKMMEPGTALTPETGPTKEGYVFGGWSGLPETMPNHDVEVTAQFYLYGDVNTDSKVNVVDVVDIARYVVETPSVNFRAKLADLNKDLAVNIADAVVLVNHIAGDQNFARAMEPSKTYNYDLCQLQLQSTQENALSLCLDGYADFTAFQFDVELPQGIDISAISINGQRKDGHHLLYNKVAENRYRVAALSLSNAVFKGSEGELLNIDFEGAGSDDICIRDIHFITTNGTDIRFDDLQGNSIVTGIKDYSHHEKEEIFDLQGRRLSKLQRGVNIVNGHKVVVK